MKRLPNRVSPRITIAQVARRGGGGAAPGGDRAETYFNALVEEDLVACWRLADTQAAAVARDGMLDDHFLGINGVDLAATIGAGSTIVFADLGDNPFDVPDLGVLNFATPNNPGIYLPSDVSFLPSAPHTVIAWMKPAADATVTKLWKNVDTGTADGIEVGTNVYPAPFYAYAWNGGAYTGGEGTGVVTRGAWNMVAYTYDGAGTARIYLDAALVGTKAGLVVGPRDQANRIQFANAFKGKMSFLSYHEAALTQAELAALRSLALA